MKRLVLNSKPGHVLVEGGETVAHGGEFEVTDDRAAELLADTAIHVSLSPTDYTQLSRPALNDLATKAGIENPEQLPNKDAVIAAINEPTQPDAAGEGQDSDPEEDS